MLGMEELDEALQEVWALLHLTLSSFDKVLTKGKTKTCDANGIDLHSHPHNGVNVVSGCKVYDYRLSSVFIYYNIIFYLYIFWLYHFVS